MKNENVKHFVHPLEMPSFMEKSLQDIFGVSNQRVTEILCKYQRENKILEHGGWILCMDIPFLEQLTGSKPGTFRLQEAFR